jgi:hypothetical protein
VITTFVFSPRRVLRLWMDNIECAVAESRLGVVLQLGVERGLITIHCKVLVYYEMLHRTKDLAGFFGATQEMENGRPASWMGLRIGSSGGLL